MNNCKTNADRRARAVFWRWYAAGVVLAVISLMVVIS